MAVAAKPAAMANPVNVFILKCTEKIEGMVGRKERREESEKARLYSFLCPCDHCNVTVWLVALKNQPMTLMML